MATKKEQKLNEIVELLKPDFDRLMRVGKITQKDLKTKRKIK